MAYLEIRNLTKEYGKVKALDGFTLEVEHNELVVILGQPGAGKTTLLMTLAGLESFTQGEIILDDEDIIDKPTELRDIAMVFETYALYPHLTVWENITFCFYSYRAKRAGLSKEKITERVKRITEMLEISDLLKRYPRELSGGQMQRVSLARALVRSPKLLLLDEPIAHLDAKLRHRLRPELRRLQKQTGVATLYTTTDYMEAFGIADKILVLHQGLRLQMGTKEDIWNKPAHRIIGNLLGVPSMNIIPGGRPKIMNGKMNIFTEDGLQIPVDKEQQTRIQEKSIEKIDIGIHPSDINLVGAGEHKPALRGEIYVYEPLGIKGALSVKVNKRIIRVQTPARYEQRKVGEKIDLYFKETDTHLFDSKSGLNILFMR